MYCIYDINKKVIFWWNPKSGCSFIKKLFLFLLNKEIKYTDAIDPLLHYNSHNSYEPFMKDYTNILFIRNPYHRFVSTFIQIYIKEWGELDVRLTQGITEKNIHKLTFNNFINIILNNKKY